MTEVDPRAPSLTLSLSLSPLSLVAEEGGAAPAARVVVRRELGTISPINVYLKPPSSVAKHAEQAIRLTCMEEPGSLSTYVMKVRRLASPPHHTSQSTPHHTNQIT